jgi:hypothetical protein
MSRLRLTPKVEEYVARWQVEASPEDRERIAQVLEAMADGSWLRWFPDEEDGEYLPAPAWTKFWPDKGLVVMIQVEGQSPDGVDEVTRMGIYRAVDPTEDEFGVRLPFERDEP